MFVFEPSTVTYENLLEKLQVTTPTCFAEQDFLNMFFRDVYKPIPLDYNMVLAMLWRHPENVDLENVKVVHYCANGSKPWRFTGKEENMQREDIKILVKKWWDIYNDPSLDVDLAEESVGEAEPLSELEMGACEDPLKVAAATPAAQFIPLPPAA
eukprot:TRINITY_DN23754_c0_g2_i1.p1 TRINITY_DN23754_c0_g2~~TRINITY_DN23754_c0_g2_i1.p1  ORF type:complete len:155 (+),score=10.51 TRINITY_DN23754_c0_g2_i1:3-467(+)